MSKLEIDVLPFRKDAYSLRVFVVTTVSDLDVKPLMEVIKSRMRQLAEIEASVFKIAEENDVPDLAKWKKTVAKEIRDCLTKRMSQVIYDPIAPNVWLRFQHPKKRLEPAVNVISSKADFLKSIQTDPVLHAIRDSLKFID